MGKSFYDWPAPAFASHFRPGSTQVTVAAKPCQTAGPDHMGQSPSPDVQGWPQPVPIPKGGAQCSRLSLAALFPDWGGGMSPAGEALPSRGTP